MTSKTPAPKSLIELEAGECRWPVGDPRREGFHFCGAPQALGRPYCVQHWQISFVPAKSRQSPAQIVEAPKVPQIAAKRAA